VNNPIFSIVIPCYNESASLETLIDEASGIAANHNGEFILVDNGSSDDTLRILKECTKPNIRWVTTAKNLGYGGGILLGLKNCNSDIIGWTHADLQTPLADVVKATSAIGINLGFVKGRRINRPYFDNFFTVGMSVLESLLFRTRLVDINAQPTVFRKDVYNSWSNPPIDFSIDLYALINAKKTNVGIGRIKVQFHRRKYGNSSWNTGINSRWKFIRRTISYSLVLRKQLLHANYSASHKLER
jgi:glycosyltransferase involved in cell wall biosynthesis